MELKLSAQETKIRAVESKLSHLETKLQAVATTSDTLTKNIESLKTSDRHQETRIKDNIQGLKAISTRGIWCGHQHTWNTTGTISYGRQTFSSTNMAGITKTPLNI